MVPRLLPISGILGTRDHRIILRHWLIPGIYILLRGRFNVTLQAINTSGCPDTTVKQLTMFPPPTCEYIWAYGSINQQIIFHIDSSSTDWGAIGNMVLWSFGDGTYGYGWNPVHIYPSGGTFDVTLTVTDTIGCLGTVQSSDLYPCDADGLL